jgi:hypothetical protein
MNKSKDNNSNAEVSFRITALIIKSKEIKKRRER